MKIKDMVFCELQHMLNRPFVTSQRRADCINSILITVFDEAGSSGTGEATPVREVTGESLADVSEALRVMSEMLAGREITSFDDIRDIDSILSSLKGNLSARAGVISALCVLLARNLNTPIYKLLEPDCAFRTSIKSDITISLADTKEMVKAAVAAYEAGYDILKLKLGAGRRESVKCVKEIRAELKDAVIRIDPNQVWTPRKAVKIIRELEDMDMYIELAEQPVKGRVNLAYVAKNTSTLIVADECVFDATDAVLAFESGIEMVNIKLMKSGGLIGALEICAAAEKYARQCMLGCMLESPESCAIAAQLAFSRRVVTKFDLDGFFLSKARGDTSFIAEGSRIFPKPEVIENA